MRISNWNGQNAIYFVFLKKQTIVERDSESQEEDLKDIFVDLVAVVGADAPTDPQWVDFTDRIEVAFLLSADIGHCKQTQENDT